MHHIWRLFLFHYNELTITTTFHQVCVCVCGCCSIHIQHSLSLSVLSLISPHSFIFASSLVSFCLSCLLFFFPFSCTSFPFFLSNSFLLFYLICTNFSSVFPNYLLHVVSLWSTSFCLVLLFYIIFASCLYVHSFPLFSFSPPAYLLGFVILLFVVSSALLSPAVFSLSQYHPCPSSCHSSLFSFLFCCCSLISCLMHVC